MSNTPPPKSEIAWIALVNVTRRVFTFRGRKYVFTNPEQRRKPSQANCVPVEREIATHLLTITARVRGKGRSLVSVPIYAEVPIPRDWRRRLAREKINGSAADLEAALAEGDVSAAVALRNEPKAVAAAMRRAATTSADEARADLIAALEARGVEIPDDLRPAGDRAAKMLEEQPADLDEVAADLLAGSWQTAVAAIREIDDPRLLERAERLEKRRDRGERSTVIRALASQRTALAEAAGDEAEAGGSLVSAADVAALTGDSRPWIEDTSDGWGEDEILDPDGGGDLTRSELSGLTGDS